MIPDSAVLDRKEVWVGPASPGHEVQSRADGDAVAGHPLPSSFLHHDSLGPMGPSELCEGIRRHPQASLQSASPASPESLALGIGAPAVTSQALTATWDREVQRASLQMEKLQVTLPEEALFTFGAPAFDQDAASPALVLQSDGGTEASQRLVLQHPQHMPMPPDTSGEGSHISEGAVADAARGDLPASAPATEGELVPSSPAVRSSLPTEQPAKESEPNLESAELTPKDIARGDVISKAQDPVLPRDHNLRLAEPAVREGSGMASKALAGSGFHAQGIGNPSVEGDKSASSVADALVLNDVLEQMPSAAVDASSASRERGTPGAEVNSAKTMDEPGEPPAVQMSSPEDSLKLVPPDTLTSSKHPTTSSEPTASGPDLAVT